MTVTTSSPVVPTRPDPAAAVETARAALAELGETAVGAHLGVTVEDECAVTHRFAATLPGYHGWQWAVVLAAVPDADRVTVSESALLPGPEALTAPEWVPWDQRVRPGDLTPGDLLAPAADDLRLTPGFTGTGDPAIDDVVAELGLGRTWVLSRDGRLDAAQRWYDGEFGPAAEMSRSATARCVDCGFYLALSGALHDEFGVCTNEYAADGRVVSAGYGCGAHSDTVIPPTPGLPDFGPYDDGSVELVDPAARVEEVSSR
ncbi:DUF3027 domain-containing protein [Skermania piniformis]|uniref:DUF3027 domain-containing protein n=1 Tax=Skermania pinensis TaxID=39122 RepID=A0ABX8SA93_9ACTN|nr:DUF3027 domain-containing protein [Skermania piniformis]QXQ13395.1 DUF3027 domain-containing protein [Skermania piniformis]